MSTRPAIFASRALFSRLAATLPVAVFGLGAGLSIGAHPAFAQDAAQKAGTAEPSAPSIKSSPFAASQPGQSQPAPTETPTGLKLGVLHWYPIASRCAFIDPDKAGETKADVDPYVFLTMTEQGGGTTARIERGYVMANGLVRELEKGKTAPNKDGDIVTVWRSAGEPRINVNIVLHQATGAPDDVKYAGSLTIFWGDKKEQVKIEGSCQD